MEIIVTVPDELIPYLEEALGGMPFMAMPTPGMPDVSPETPVDLSDRLRKQWENEIDQRVTSFLSQKAQTEAAATVSAAREAANAETTVNEASVKSSYDAIKPAASTVVSSSTTEATK